MASRFAAGSPWRNLVAKNRTAYSELPVTASDQGRGIALLDDSHILVRGNTPGSCLVVLRVGEEHTGKYGNQADSLLLPAAAADLEASSFDEGLIAVGCEDGTISILRRHVDSGPAIETSWKHPEANGPVLVRWHPQSDILMTASPSSPFICVWMLPTSPTSKPQLTITVEVAAKAGGKFVYDMAWSRDGTSVYAGLGDGTVKAYDPRRPSSACMASTPPPLGYPKPLRIAATSEYLLLSTLNTSRQRELRLFALQDLTRTLQVITLDTSSHPLTLTVDNDRNLVFLASKGDVNVRWIELDVSRKFSQGAFALPPRTTFGSSTLLPPLALDVMQAEIDRLYVLSSGGEVIPIRIEIPQRQLVDFHPHLYPNAVAGVQALEAKDWLDGRNAELIRVSMDPATRADWLSLRSDKTRSASSAQAGSTASASISAIAPVKQPIAPNETGAATISPSEEHKSTAAPAIADVETDTATKYLESSTTSAVPAFAVPRDSLPQAPSSQQSESKSELALPSRSPAAASTSSHSSASLASASKRVVPTRTVDDSSSSSWSRATLSGITPLIPAFSSIPAFDVSTSPSARAFIVTPLHLIFPLSGAGGRLAFHEVTREGRLPEAQAMSWIETGSTIADFEADILNPRRVATIDEDGVKVWLLPSALSLKGGGEAISRPEEEYSQRIVRIPEMTLALTNLGRTCKVSFNPVAADVLLLAGADGLAIADISSGEVKILDTLMDGVAEAEWALDGSLIAFARSDRTLAIWDPRSGKQAGVAAHDSSRPFKICWIDEAHLLTVGHMAGSTRQVKLFELSREKDSLAISEKGRLALDTSPAILFPYYDADAQLIYLWSKGERSISVLQLSLDPPKPRFGAGPSLFRALPGFQHSTPQLGVSFLPKRYCNVSAVEVGLSYRLARSQEIQIVSWRVERKRKDFFQDDVFPPTRDVEYPALSASEWWGDGTSVMPLASLPHIDLLPNNMVPLSQAPPPVTTTSSLAKGPTQKMMTAKEREDELMSNVFSKAKGREGEEEQEQTAARRRAPDDDDWGEDD